MVETKTEVTIPPGTVYVDGKGQRFDVFYSPDMDRESLTVARAFAFGAAKRAVVVVGDDQVEIMSADAFAALGLDQVED